MVELIPKASQQKNHWNLIFYFSLFLAISAFVAFFVMNSLLNSSLKDLSDLQEKLGQIRTSEKNSLEKEVLSYQRKINDFSLLSEKHMANSRIFSLVQQFCHPKVWFSNFSFDSKNNQISLSGLTDSFESLGQQIMILEGKSYVKDLKLESMSIGSKKEIAFSLVFTTNPQIFK